MPEPIRSRYQFDSGSTIRLPCDDRKVADHIHCEKFFVYCTDPEQTIDLKIQGSGDVFTVNEKCKTFMNRHPEFDWDRVTKLITDRNFDQFNKEFKDAGGRRKVFTLNSVEPKNKYGTLTTTSDSLVFKFEVGHRLHSNEPRCY